MYKLIIEDDEGKTTVVPLIRDEITIGRKEGNTIRLTERNVSRRHAKLTKSNGSLFIEDLQSYNGVKVNGDKIAGRSTIAEGDRIQIGDYQLALKVEKAKDEDDATRPFIRDDLPAPTVKAAAVAGPAPTTMTPPIEAPSTDDRPARVVVTSSNFAGQEFVLDKSTMVIGRTDDNDIVINHRSISRHHAQIVREGTHYHVVDMQSANGVRVNGEEYGKVELRKGDHVDLGHVRLRFVAPGEDFVFDRDAEVVDVGGKDGKKGGFPLVPVAIIGVLLIGGGVFAAMKLGGKGSDKPSADVETTVAKLSIEIDKLIKTNDWDGAIAKCDEGLKLDPHQEVLRDKKAKAESEKKNQTAFDRYEKAVGGNDVDSAVAAYQEIADDSVYHDKAAPTWQRIKASYIKTNLDKARRSSDCNDVRKYAENILILDQGNADAQEVGRKCNVQAPPPRAPEASRPKHTGGGSSSGGNESLPKPPREEKPAHTEPVVAATTPTPKPTPPPSPPPSAPSGGGEDAAKSLSEAQQDYVHGNYSGAIDKAKAALKGGSPAQATQAWRIIGSSSCFLKDKDGAVKAWNRLDNQGRQFLRYVCANRNNIEIP